jgi:putative ABC transport system substrate-binding protein
MKRREFISFLGGAAAWPIAAQAQQREQMRRAGVLMSYVESDTGAQKWAKAFDDSLQELGWNNGRNIKLDYRWGGPNPDGLRGDAEDLVRLSPDVLLAGATPAVIALQHATGSIPIVFANVADPVGQGFIASFARPGGNTTGFGGFDFSIAGKWVQIIKEIAPAVARIGVIFNRETGPYNESMLPFIETASGPLSVKPIPTAIHDSESIAQTLEKLAEEPNTGLIVLPAAMFTTYRDIIITTAARLRIPTVYPFSFFCSERWPAILWI